MASVLMYQQLLAAVTYSNKASEPTQGVRTLTFQVSDDTFTSNTLVGSISIGLIDDNELILTCGINTRTYIEGSADTVYIVPNLTLVDLDVDHIIISANIALTNSQYGDLIYINSTDTNGLFITSTNNSITIEGESTATEYQVCSYLYNN